MKLILNLLIIIIILNCSSNHIVAQDLQNSNLQSFRFEGADIDTVMDQYCLWTKKSYLKTDAVQANITLKANQLTTDESIQVVEAILAMNGIALIPMGDKFIKVVQANSTDLVGQGLEIDIDENNNTKNNDEFVTSVIPLQNVQIKEVQAAIQHILHSYGKILTLERSNSIMITDTASNIKRAKELINFIDQATAQIEQRIYQIKHADAEAIADKIEEIIDAAQGEESSNEISGNSYVRTARGIIRAGDSTNNDVNESTKQASISNTESSSTVLIQGEVKVLSDKRTNIIIIFSQADNFTFFEKIIEVLDVMVDPVTTFEVVNLEYADAEELSETLNSLIGSSNKSKNDSSSSSRNNQNSNIDKQEIQNKNDNVNNLDKLSDETKILADIRSNSILLMGEKRDIDALKRVIATLDIKLEQVMIEAAIFEVTLNDSLSSGIDWLYQESSSTSAGFNAPTLLNSTNTLPGVQANALTYYQNITGINTEVAINLAAQDSNVRLLSTPVIMTTDNTEARLSVGEQRPVVTSTSSFGNSSGTLRSSYEYKDIGINLTVTPRINPQRVVVMEVLQQADQIGGTITIDDNEVPLILNREFEAQIAIPDRGTIALGGLINTEKRNSKTKIPLLGDIPFIGKYLFSTQTDGEVQTELIVLLTPYVLTSKEELETETARRYDGTDMKNKDWPSKGWSDSKLQYRDKNIVDKFIKNKKEQSQINTIKIKQ